MRQYSYHILSAVILLIFLSPFFFKKDFKCLVGDNLNQHIAINSIIAQNDALCMQPEEIVPYIMGGIPRGFLKSELNFVFLLYKYLSTNNAYRIIKILICLVAFFGMLLFLNRYIFNYKNKSLTYLISTAFATLPFFPNGFLTIAGQPLLLFSYLNIYYKKDNIYDWLLIGIFPFFSSLVLGNLFFHIFLFAFFISKFFMSRKVNYKIIFSFLIFILFSIVAEYRLFDFTFFSDFFSSRDEMLILGTLNFKGVIGTSLIFLIKGHRHFASLHFPFIILIIVAALIFIKTLKTNKLFMFLIIIVIFSVSFENFFYGWQKLNFLKLKSSFINSFTFRFYSILPLAFYLLLGISLQELCKIQKKRFFLYFFVFLIVGNNMFGTKNMSSENVFYHSYFNEKSKTHYSINDFYSKHFISSIKTQLKLNKNDMVACVGFPSVLLNYNNISTIGGFLNNYPLKFKDRMRKIITPELSKNKQLKKRFDYYGVRCEILSSELSNNNSVKKINDLSLNFAELRNYNCNYIFSKYPIENFDREGKLILKKYNRNQKAYLSKIFIYKV